MTVGTRALVYLALAWLAAVFDNGLAPLLMLGGCGPSACLLAAVLCISLHESRYAFLGSAVFGLAADVTGAGRLGVAVACFALIGYAVMQLQLRSRAGRLVLAALAMPSLVGVLEQCFEPSSAFSSSCVQSLGNGTFTAVCAAPVLLVACLRGRGC